MMAYLLQNYLYSYLCTMFFDYPAYAKATAGAAPTLTLTLTLIRGCFGFDSKSAGKQACRATHSIPLNCSANN
jgi:hypothetical protein